MAKWYFPRLRRAMLFMPAAPGCCFFDITGAMLFMSASPGRCYTAAPSDAVYAGCAGVLLFWHCRGGALRLRRGDDIYAGCAGMLLFGIAERGAFLLAAPGRCFTAAPYVAFPAAA